MDTIGLPSRGTGNATVPNDAPIQPPQAFVNNIAAFFGGDNTYGTAGAVSTPDASVPVTFVDPQTYGVALTTVGGANGQGYIAPSVLFSAGHALPTSNIDDLLSISAGGGVNYLDLRGPNMGVPTPASSYAPHEDASLSVQLQDPIPDSANIVLSLTASGITETIFYSNNIDFSASTFAGSSGGDTIIGVQDSPSMTSVVDFLNGNYSGPRATIGLTINEDGSGNGSDAFESDYPITATGPAVVSSNPGVVGSTFQPNASITQMYNNNATVFVQEYINRFDTSPASGETEVVAYSN